MRIYIVGNTVSSKSNIRIHMGEVLVNRLARYE